MPNHITIKKKIGNFRKKISVSGDKSISIRWVLISSLAKGISRAKNLLISEDVLAAIKSIKKLGINWEEDIKNYSKNARPVQTASLLQVRGSIKKNTSEEWKKYRVHLKIMQETLDSAKIKY